MAIAGKAFGEHKGKRVDQFTLRSDTGVEVEIIGYGVVVRDWRVPVTGGMRSVVLGFETFEPYPLHSPHFGSLAGRVANRIKGASFEIDGKRYDIPPNWKGHALHGGAEGLGHIVWDAETDETKNAVRFTHTSPDGHMGFPGNVKFTATYSLTGNRLRLDLAAITDEKTPISLVQHQYFNLGTTGDILDHRYQIASGAFTDVDADLIPTGAILPSAGTKWDLRQPRTMRDAGGQAIVYDGNMVLDQDRDVAAPAATVVAPDGSVTLRLMTDRPGVQLYNAAYTDIPVPGLNGKIYGKHSGFCLEDQSFPDTLHNRHFPPIWCTPEKPYSHWCEIEIA